MPSVDAVLTRAADYAPERVAVHEWGRGRQITYRVLEAWANAFAARLVAAGVGRGQRVAIHLPNGAHFLAAQFGSLRAGAVATFVNYRLLSGEALRQISMAEARVVVTTRERAAELADQPMLRDALFLIEEGAASFGESLPDVLQRGGARTAGPLAQEDDDAIARFTSGSTGAPKGVIVSHRAWLIRAVSMLAEEIKAEAHSTTMVLGALSHHAGLFVLPTFMRQGTLLVFDHFDLDDAAAALRDCEVAQMQMVPTMLQMILEHRGMREALAAARVKQVAYGGSPIGESVVEAALDLLPQCDFVQGYGSHEAGAISHLDGPAHRDPVLRRSAGRPFLVAEVRTAPPADGCEYGEIEVRAPWTPRARITERGREPVTEEWIPTGDLGELRDGFVFLMDRAHDLIISGGFNVYPSEVEGVLGAHPAVAVCAVVSMPDAKWGEKVVAYFVPQRGQAPDEASLREHCRARLSNYKVPKEYRAVGELPLNANGKPDRRRLSEPLWQGQQRRIN